MWLSGVLSLMTTPIAKSSLMSFSRRSLPMWPSRRCQSVAHSVLGRHCVDATSFHRHHHPPSSSSFSLHPAINHLPSPRHVTRSLQVAASAVSKHQVISDISDRPESRPHGIKWSVSPEIPMPSCRGRVSAKGATSPSYIPGIGPIAVELRSGQLILSI